MIRKAVPQDLPALLAFLQPRVATSLFLSGNLHDHGLNATGNRTATQFWIAESDGKIQAVFGSSEAGYLMCEAPVFDLGWSADLRRAMAGRKVIGLSGEVGQATVFRAALGLADHPASFEDVEPHFLLKLDDLIIPDGTTQLRAPGDADLPQLVAWRLAYDQEVFGEDDTAENRCKSEQRVSDLVQNGRLRLLTHQDAPVAPVAMTGFNAALPDIVQIGSVYTPPKHRGQGHARRALALHLAQAHAAGVKSAVLFASGPAAVRAYASIGFKQIGEYAQVAFAHRFTLGDPT
ncbi:MAG: GNAT family N-acetyltransferase [Rhodobacteraceae bacterium]|nr:GNAT family N-acetyltransferase [Paracoccaceae bacterium]